MGHLNLIQKIDWTIYTLIMTVVSMNYVSMVLHMEHLDELFFDTLAFIGTAIFFTIPATIIHRIWLKKEK